MPRILVAGLSPAWQQILVFDEFHAGAVNRACEVHWCASGKVLNVGIALAHIAANTDLPWRVLSVIGPRGRAEIAAELSEMGARFRWFETASGTRICTTIVDRTSGRTTELVENASPIATDEIARFREAFGEEASAADVVVLTGSLPNVATSCGDHRPAEIFYRDLLAMTNARAVLDVRGPELLAALECRPYCVKPNRTELGATLNRDLATDDELRAAMRELNERGAQWVIVTHGAQAVWASHGGDLYKFQPPLIEHVVNPIGSGDCLAAGIAWATAAGCDMLAAVRFGIAAAADNVGQLLPARLDAGRIAELERRVGIS